MQPSFVTRAYPETLAGGYSRVDGTIEFYTRVNSLLRPSMEVLDFGAGRGEWTQNDHLDYRRGLRNLKGKVRRVIGVDVDDAVLANPSLDDALTFSGDHIPLPNQSIDMVVADHVFEHIPSPEVTSGELTRVLRPGGWLCVRTPHKFSYVAIANQIIPQALKAKILHAVQPGRADEDVFPALYRLNTLAAMRRHFFGYTLSIYPWNGEPGYHGGNALLFAAIRAWQVLSPYPTSLMGFMQKPTAR